MIRPTHSRGERARTAALLLAVATLAACGRERAAAAARPALPGLRLAPMLPRLHELAAPDAAPDAAMMRELRELADVALGIVPTDERTLARAERALLDHPRAKAALTPALQHADPAIRRRAAWLCGRSGHALLSFSLLLALKDEGDAETALWIAHALHRCGNDAGLPWLDAAMGRADTAERAGDLALDVVRGLGDDPGPSPTWEDLQDALRRRTAAWIATGSGSHPPAVAADAAAVAAIVARHLAATAGSALRPVDEARFVMVHSGTAALPLLRPTLAASESYLRAMALQVLAELGPMAHALADAVLPLLDDPMTETYAMRALGELDATDTAPHLRARLEHGDTEVRAAAANALGLLRDAASGPRFDALLADTREPLDVRVQAAFGRLRLGPDAVATAFLTERDRRGDYHAPTLQHLRERLAQKAP